MQREEGSLSFRQLRDIWYVLLVLWFFCVCVCVPTFYFFCYGQRPQKLEVNQHLRTSGKASVDFKQSAYKIAIHQTIKPGLPASPRITIYLQSTEISAQEEMEVSGGRLCSSDTCGSGVTCAGL